MPDPGFMQVAGGLDSDSDDTISITFGVTVTAGSGIVGMVEWHSNTVDLLTIEDDQSNVYTIYDNPTGDGGNFRAATFAAPNVIGGIAVTVTATFSAAIGSTGVIVVHEVSDVATSNMVDQHAINNQNFVGTAQDVVTSGAVTTTTNGQYIFSVPMSRFGAAPGGVTAGTGFDQQSGPQPWVNSEDKIQTTAGSIAATWTPTVDDGWLTCIVTLRGTGGGGGGSTVICCG